MEGGRRQLPIFSLLEGVLDTHTSPDSISLPLYPFVQVIRRSRTRPARVPPVPLLAYRMPPTLSNVDEFDPRCAMRITGLGKDVETWSGSVPTSHAFGTTPRRGQQPHKPSTTHLSLPPPPLSFPASRRSTPCPSHLAQFLVPFAGQYKLRWIDDTTCLAVFPTPRHVHAAVRVLSSLPTTLAPGTARTRLAGSATGTSGQAQLPLSLTFRVQPVSRTGGGIGG